jgi:hypothetical protein
MARRLGVAVDLAPDPSLVALPAAGQVIGDPSKTRRLLGLSWRPSPDSLAEELLGGDAAVRLAT